MYTYVNCLSDIPRSSAVTCSLMMLVTLITLQTNIKSKPGSSPLQMNSVFSCFFPAKLHKMVHTADTKSLFKNYILSAHPLSGLPMGGGIV